MNMSLISRLLPWSMVGWAGGLVALLAGMRIGQGHDSLGLLALAAAGTMAVFGSGVATFLAVGLRGWRALLDDVSS
jgi:hypothetical protein